MDEGIKRIFRRHMRRKAEAAKNISGINFKSFNSVAAYAMYELTELYSEICGISYYTAAAELHEGDNDDDDVTAVRRVYRRERGELQYGLDINSKYQDAVMRSDKLRISVDKAGSVEDKLRFALDCVELLTGEGGFAARNLRKVGLV